MESLDYPEIAQNFSLQRSALQKSVRSNTTEYSEILQQMMAAFEQLRIAVEPIASSQQRAALTEIHRLLQFVKRSGIFWQMAKQPESRAARQEELLGFLEKIAEWEQVFAA
jgi:uncharacterized protein YcgL (UPF0745 family)